RIVTVDSHYRPSILAVLLTPPASPEIYPLSLHDALPISMKVLGIETSCDETGVALYDSEAGLLADALHSQIDLHRRYGGVVPELDRKSTRLNSSHVKISYAVFCLKKKTRTISIRLEDSVS